MPVTCIQDIGLSVKWFYIRKQALISNTPRLML